MPLHFTAFFSHLDTDTTLYLISALLQLAAMCFAIAMMRAVNDKRPWLLLFAALLIMFVMRLVAIRVPLAQRVHINPMVAAPVSLLLLSALVSLRRVAVAEKTARRDAVLHAAERDESDRRYRALIEMSPDALFVKSGGRIVYANAAAATFFRAIDAAGLIDLDVAQLIAPDYRSKSLVFSARGETGGAPAPTEEHWLRLDGTEVEVEVVAAGVSWHGGRGVQVILRDITDRKSEEREKASLLASERAARSTAEHANRMKDEFLATLSHELRTPLNAILGWANLLRNADHGGGDIEQGLTVIERNARVQTKLIEDLLDMSRIISGKLRLEVQHLLPIDFTDAALETVRPAAEARGVRLTQSFDPLAGPIQGDPQRLQQVVWNLLSNAIKFTPRGGEVKVTLKRVESNVEIVVADTGQGIAPEFLGSVFDRFRQADSSMTRRHGGLGIGLSIVKQLVELHGGTVNVESEGLERGSTFTVSLPLVAVHVRHEDGPRLAAAPVRTTSAKRIDIDLSSLKILVVDDEPDAAALVTRVLIECGASVRTASSAADALDAIEEERPDILVSDIGMPDMDGYELLRRVRALDADRGTARLPAVALTAFARSEDRTRSLMAGYSFHVSKPVEPSELVATVASLAGRTGIVSTLAPAVES